MAGVSALDQVARPALTGGALRGAFTPRARRRAHAARIVVEFRMGRPGAGESGLPLRRSSGSRAHEPSESAAGVALGVAAPGGGSGREAASGPAQGK